MGSAMQNNLQQCVATGADNFGKRDIPRISGCPDKGKKYETKSIGTYGPQTVHFFLWQWRNCSKFRLSK